MTPAELVQMMRALPNHVTGLLLCGPDVNDEAAQILVDSIENNALRHLDLFHCGLTQQHAQSIAQVLGTNSSLTHLGLYEDGIGHVGLTAIFNALRDNNTLTTFECTGDIEEGSVKVLDDVLKTNHTLREILCITDGAYNPPLPLYTSIGASLERNGQNAPSRGLNLMQRMMVHCYESGFFEGDAETSNAASSSNELSDDRFAKREPTAAWAGEGSAKRQRR